jgi:hypothetical protein
MKRINSTPALPRRPAFSLTLASSPAWLFAMLTITFGLFSTAVTARAADALDNWEQVAPGQLRLLFWGVAFGNDTFVGVGAAGLIATSSDTFYWTARSNGTNYQYRSVTYGQDKFVAVGNRVPTMDSPDGVTWSFEPGGKTHNLYGVTFGNGTFVAVGASGTILSSPDGRTWTPQDSGVSPSLNSVAFGNGLFVAVGFSGTIVTSPDGVIWTPQASMTSETFYSVAAGNGTFVAIGSSGMIIHSADGASWIPTPLENGGILNAVTWGGHTFVIVGYGYVNPFDAHLWTSPDGANWTRRKSNIIDTLEAVAFGNGRFVAVGESGAIIRSGILGQPEQGPIVQKPRRNGDGMQFFFNSQPDRSYEVQSSTNLVDWTKVRTISAFGPTTSFSELTHGGRKKFYRVQKLPE